MARMIDADALQELCDRRIQDTWNNGTAPVSWAAAYADFKDDIDSMPTLTQPNEPLTLEHLRASPHGKIKDSTLQSICNRANEIACRPPEGEEETP